MHQTTLRNTLSKTLFISSPPDGIILTHALIPDFSQLIDYVSFRATVLKLFLPHTPCLSLHL